MEEPLLRIIIENMNLPIYCYKYSCSPSKTVARIYVTYYGNIMDLFLQWLTSSWLHKLCSFASSIILKSKAWSHYVSKTFSNWSRRQVDFLSVLMRLKMDYVKNILLCINAIQKPRTSVYRIQILKEKTALLIRMKPTPLKSNFSAYYDTVRILDAL